MRFLVTGGAGFIASHFVDNLIDLGHSVIVLDLLTYAGNKVNLNKRASFCHGDIRNKNIVQCLINEFDFDGVFNFAAESHVCRSIDEPESFINSNVYGTYVLINECLKWWRDKKREFRFIQVSTDEVFGELGPTGRFNEWTPYSPQSPYSSSKASADHLVMAWNHTYGLPTVITHCSNNYGPRQYPEKLIPITIKRLLSGGRPEIHGDGSNVRDWIHVDDHCRGVWSAFKNGVPGLRYCFGGDCEKTNLAIVSEIKNIMGSDAPILFVKDRPGNDKRYAIDDSFARKTLGWERIHEFENGIKETVAWYLDHRDWIK